ncbi:MAG: LCP family protein [Clostridia bacterium]|nr:LCP family protein [Clostridia bacterium]
MPDVYFNKDKNRKNPSGRTAKNTPQSRPSQGPQRRPAQAPPRHAPQDPYAGRPPQTPTGVKKERDPWKIFLIVVLVLVLIYVSIAHILFGGMNYDPKQHKHNNAIASIELKRSPMVRNILLLGSDAREGDTTFRSDTMMLISIDKSHKQYKLTSFLRDSYVEIPGHGKNKLNAACALGGIPLVINTLEYNYGVKINNYVCVDFQAFTALIDAIGGIDVPVTRTEANYLNRTWYKWTLTGNRLHFDSGDSVHLDGEQALMFARIRKLDSDIQRTRRQRLVMSAVQKKLSEADKVDLLKMVRSIMPYLQTDIGATRMMNLAIAAGTRYRNYEVVQKTIPVPGTYYDASTNAGDSLVFDIDRNAAILKDYLYHEKGEIEP